MCGFGESAAWARSAGAVAVQTSKPAQMNFVKAFCLMLCSFAVPWLSPQLCFWFCSQILKSEPDAYHAAGGAHDGEAGVPKLPLVPMGHVPRFPSPQGLPRGQVAVPIGRPPGEKELLEKLAGPGWAGIQMYSRLSPRELAALRAGETLKFSSQPFGRGRPTGAPFWLGASRTGVFAM